MIARQNIVAPPRSPPGHRRFVVGIVCVGIVCLIIALALRAWDGSSKLPPQGSLLSDVREQRPTSGGTALRMVPDEWNSGESSVGPSRSFPLAEPPVDQRDKDIPAPDRAEIERIISKELGITADRLRTFPAGAIPLLMRAALLDINESEGSIRNLSDLYQEVAFQLYDQGWQKEAERFLVRSRLVSPKFADQPAGATKTPLRHLQAIVTGAFRAVWGDAVDPVRTATIRWGDDAPATAFTVEEDAIEWSQVPRSEGELLLLIPAPNAEAGVLLANDRALYAPDGSVHRLEIHDDRFLQSLGFDESRGHTLELMALRYAPGGRFVAVRGSIRVPTPHAIYGTERNPPRIDDLDHWEYPRDGIDCGIVTPLVRGGFEGVLDRSDGTLIPIRVWTSAEFTPGIVRWNPDPNAPAALPPPEPSPGKRFVPRGPVIRPPPRGEVHMFAQETHLPEERVLLALSAEGEYVATADVNSHRFDLLRRAPRGYEVALSLDCPFPERPLSFGRSSHGRSDYDFWYPGLPKMNPCAAFAGPDGRTLLVHQGDALSIWRLEERPRLLAKRGALSLQWFMVSPDGACAVGVAGYEIGVHDLDIENFGVDLFVDGLDGERPRISVLGTLLQSSNRLGSQGPFAPLYAAMDADTTQVRILFTRGGPDLYLIEIPRP